MNLYVVFCLWIFSLSCVILNIVIISYLYLKPLGSRTLLDALYIGDFFLVCIVVMFYSCVHTITQVDVVLSENAAMVTSYLFRLVVDVLQFTLLTTTILHSVLANFPTVLADVDENKVLFGTTIANFSLACMTCMLSYGMGQLPYSYYLLTNQLEHLPNRQIGVQIVIASLNVVAFVTHKLVLVVTKNVLTEGENNIMSMWALFGFFMGKAVGMLFAWTYDLKLAYYLTTINLFPMALILTKKTLRNFAVRRCDRMFGSTLTRTRVLPTMSNVVEPEIELSAM